MMNFAIPVAFLISGVLTLNAFAQSPTPTPDLKWYRNQVELKRNEALEIWKEMSYRERLKPIGRLFSAGLVVPAVTHITSEYLKPRKWESRLMLLFGQDQNDFRLARDFDFIEFNARIKFWGKNGKGYGFPARILIFGDGVMIEFSASTKVEGYHFWDFLNVTSEDLKHHSLHFFQNQRWNPANVCFFTELYEVAPRYRLFMQKLDEAKEYRVAIEKLKERLYPTPTPIPFVPGGFKG